MAHNTTHRTFVRVYTHTYFAYFHTLDRGWQKRSRAVVCEQTQPTPLLPRRRRHVAYSHISSCGALPHVLGGPRAPPQKRTLFDTHPPDIDAGPVRGGHRPTRRARSPPRAAAAIVCAFASEGRRGDVAAHEECMHLTEAGRGRSRKRRRMFARG